MSKKVTNIFGWIFIVLGVLGFISNPIVGSEGFLASNTVGNIIHLLSGAVFLWVGYSAASRIPTLLKVFGVVYLLIAILGFLSGSGMVLGFIMVNAALSWLHLILGIIFVWVGFSVRPAAMPVGAM